MEIMEIFAILRSLFYIVLVIMVILIPFFIFRIRNEVIQINEKLQTLIPLKYPEKSESSTVQKIKVCSKCGGENRYEDLWCTHCSEPLY
jgi:hypothetical protein